MRQRRTLNSKYKSNCQPEYFPSALSVYCCCKLECIRFVCHNVLEADDWVRLLTDAACLLAHWHLFCDAFRVVVSCDTRASSVSTRVSFSKRKERRTDKNWQPSTASTVVVNNVTTLQLLSPSFCTSQHTLYTPVYDIHWRINRQASTFGLNTFLDLLTSAY